MEYAIFNRPVVTIYGSPAETRETREGALSNITDEGLYGQACRVIARGEPAGWAQIETFYGYPGYVHEEELDITGESALRSRLSGRYNLIGRHTDVLSLPDAVGVRLLSLERGCLVRRLPERRPGEPDNGTPVRREGWVRVSLLDGRAGYVRSVALEPVRFTQGALFYQEGPDGHRTQIEAEAAARGIAPAWLVGDTVERWFGGLEDAFRISICQTAKLYLGIEYRWGGKSSRGIDCSGLASSVYMQNGVLIYRDAQIRPGWPVHEIRPADKKPGDLLYFPGHIAIYLGGDKYIHSTGAAASGGVVINSLNPADSRYRADLAESITAVGSVFGKESPAGQAKA